MGRHSRPDPDDLPDESSDAEAAEAAQDAEDGGYGHRFDADDTGYEYAFDAEDARDTEDTEDTDYGDAALPDLPDLADLPDFPALPDFPDFPDGDDGLRAAAAFPDDTAPRAHGEVEARRRQRRRDQWRAGHRSEAGRRGVSIGVIVALVAVVAVVGTVILWRFFGDSLSHRASGPVHCADAVPVAVVADPSIYDYVQDFADRFNGERCTSVDVRPADTDAVVAGFIGDWPAKLGDRPALWIPASSVSAARLTAAAGADTVSSSRSLVTSPVLLAVRPELKPALAKQDWATLPGLQTDADALSGLNLPGWGSLRLALPTSGNSDAAYLAGEAVAVGSAPPGAPATDGVGAVRALVNAAPKLADDSVAEAMNKLLENPDPAAAAVHAVVTTEQQVFTRGASDAGKLTYWQPPGPVPVADYPALLLGGSWLSEDQVKAANDFVEFVEKPAQLGDLAEAGFRVDGVDPPESDVTDFPALSSTLQVGDSALRASLAGTLSVPASQPAVTLVLDLSMTAEEGGNSRLANVVAALDHRIGELAPGSAVGLWVFDGVDARLLTPTGPLADDVDGQPRSTALTEALDELSSTSGGAVSFTTVPRVYESVLSDYRDGQANSMLVITAGPHTDRTLDGAGLQDYVRRNLDPQRPLPIDVIDFGDNADRDTWQAVAQLSGGSYQHVANSDSPELATALMTFLG